jgi:hypothetical protein
MKRIIAFIVISSFIQASYAQSKFKVVSIQPEQSFYLNGGARSMIGGSSRTFFQIELPQNTVAWYYVFTTTPNKKQIQSIKLAAQLNKLVAAETGVSEVSADVIFTPTGSSQADIYLFPNLTEVNKFLEKDDKKRGNFNYIIPASREHLEQGTIKIKDPLEGIYYIGLRNPSATEAVNIHIEIAAIVRVTP